MNFLKRSVVITIFTIVGTYTFAMQKEDISEKEINSSTLIYQPKTLAHCALDVFINFLLKTNNPSKLLTIENLNRLQEFDTVEERVSERNDAIQKIITGDDSFRGCAEYIVEPFSELSIPVTYLKWSPDGKYIAGYSCSGNLLIFDTIEKKWAVCYKGQSSYLGKGNFNWSSNSNYVVLTEQTGWVIIDATNNTSDNIFVPFKIFFNDVEIATATYSEPKWYNNCLVIHSKPYITLFNPQTVEYLFTLCETINCPNTENDTAPIKKLIWEMKENTIHVKNLQTEEEYSIKISEPILLSKISPYHNYIALMSKTKQIIEFGIYDSSYNIYIFHQKTKKIFKLIIPESIRSIDKGIVAWSPDEKFLVVGGQYMLHIFDVEKGYCIYQCPIGYPNLYEIVWSPNSKQIAVCSYEKDGYNSHYSFSLIDLFPLHLTLAQTVGLCGLIKNPAGISIEQYNYLKLLFASADTKTQEKIKPILEKKSQEFPKNPESKYSIITKGIISSCICLGAATLVSNPTNSLIQIIRNTDTDVPFEEPS